MSLAPQTSRSANQTCAIRPLSPGLGAAIIGLDLLQHFNTATRQTVYDAFVHYHVLCFRDQTLTNAQQIAFSEQLGPPERHIARNRGPENPQVHTVSKLDAGGRPSGRVGSQQWHSDKSFRPEPLLATILHAVTLPLEGGNTCFADVTAAYDALSEDEKSALGDVRVIHGWELSQQKSGLATC
jgi:alpha-ketoglutarate-dependent taurine dioxygenase